jgi:arylsulfatase A-like enzyme
MTPNILFIMTDHQRADSIGAVQAGKEVTPNLNRLAKRSAVFTRAYTTCPLCTPARTALSTGQYPTRTGVVFNDWSGDTARDCKPLHQYLDEAGYDVGHVGVNHIQLKPPLTERVAFEQWIDQRDLAAYQDEQGIDEGSVNVGPERSKRDILEFMNGEYEQKRFSSHKATVWPHDIEHFADSFYRRHSVQFLEQRGESSKPFALFANLWAPHPPLRVPEPYASMFPPDAIDLPSNVGVSAQGEPPGRRRGIAGQLGEGVPMEEWRQAWAAHLGLVNWADACIGRILEALEASGRADDTIVVFTTDHGEHLGQHRMYQKMEMYEPALNVPLMMHVPGMTANSFDTPVSHLDILPTLLDILGMNPSDTLDGVSLRASLESGTPPPDRPIFAQFSGGRALGDIRRAVVTRRHKYIHDPRDVPELYDLVTDPLEMTNLAGDAGHQEDVHDLHALAKEWGEAHGDWVAF